MRRRQDKTSWDPQAYTLKLAALMGLSDFDITARVDHDLNDAKATIDTDDSNEVTIRISTSAIGRGAEYVRCCVVHELLHLHSRVLWALTESIEKASDNGDPLAAIGAMMNRGEEMFLDRVAKLLSPHYPLPW